jgi:hypothetical protein
MKADKRWIDVRRFNDMAGVHKGLTADQNKLRLMAMDNPDIMFGKPARENVRESILDNRFDRLVKAVKQ